MKSFAWTEFYAEFADRLLDYRPDRPGLIEKMRKIHDQIGLKYPTVDKDGAVNDIDPFTVFGMFNKGIRNDRRIAILRGIAGEFGIVSAVPENFDGIPVLNNLKSAFFWFNKERGEDDINNLWDMFEAAIAFADEDSEVNRSRFIQCYDIVRRQKGVSWNLSMGLFWIRPYVYVNLDSVNRGYLCRPEITSPKLAETFERILHTVPGGADYLRLRDALLSAISGGACRFESLPDFSYAAWMNSKKEPVTVAEWYPENYTPGFTVEQWKALLADEELFPLNCLQIMKRMLDIGGQATCKELSDKYGENWNFYNGGSLGICRRIHAKTNCPIMPREEENSRWWPILYLGKDKDSAGSGVYIWKLRDELRAALEQTDLSHVALYANEDREEGATVNYWWLNANPDIWRFSDTPINGTQNYTLYNENNNKRRIFQNFLDVQPGDKVIGYESTPVKKIVALAKITRENDGRHIQFKKTETLENPISYADIRDFDEFSGVEGYPNFQGSLFKLTKEQYDFLMDIIREKNPVGDAKPADPYTREEFLKDVYMSERDYDGLCALLKNKKNIILQGAPGVGKTFAAKRLACSIMGVEDHDRIEMVQFHQNYSYEDFVMGYRPKGNSFELRKGIFHRFCEKAKDHPGQEYFFIIDEINRGNLSKIFGELLMLIEKTHRGEKVKLAYDGALFTVPENVYIIGMMNTADRSLAMIDYALRRRFSFFDMEPAFESEGFKAHQRVMNSAKLDAVIETVKRLNSAIAEDRTLGKGFCIGHSYFCDRENYSDEWLTAIVEYDIIPMLREYWFDDEASFRRWADELRGGLR